MRLEISFLKTDCKGVDLPVNWALQSVVGIRSGLVEPLIAVLASVGSLLRLS